MNTPTLAPMKVSSEIIRLFEQSGRAAYENAPITYVAHMMQCAMLAEEATGDTDLVVAAFLHDTGHLLGYNDPAQSMDGYGVINHEKLGAEYLQLRGFSKRVCAIVEGHVQAKRYLIATDPKYKNKLSEASLLALHWQGGPMTVREAAFFEHHPYFADLITVRRWDDLSKDPWLQLPTLSYFEPAILQHLMRQQYLEAAA